MKSHNAKPIMTLSESKDTVYSLAIMEHQIASGSVDGRLRVYDLRYGQIFVDVIGCMVLPMMFVHDRKHTNKCL